MFSFFTFWFGGWGFWGDEMRNGIISNIHLQTASSVWRSTAGKLNDDLFKAKIGGEW